LFIPVTSSNLSQNVLFFYHDINKYQVGRVIVGPHEKMIRTLQIKCVYGPHIAEPFERIIEVSERISLGALHDEIQRLAGFDNDHLYTFFIARGPRGKRIELDQTNDFIDRRLDFYHLALNDILPFQHNMKLFYWFDFGDDWIFQIGLRGKLKHKERGMKYPRVIRQLGPMPTQYPDYEDEEGPTSA